MTESQTEITVQDLIDRCNTAASTMSVENPHRLLILNLGRAIVELTYRLDAERRLVQPLVDAVFDLVASKAGTLERDEAVRTVLKVAQPLLPDAPTARSPLVVLPGGRTH